MDMYKYIDRQAHRQTETDRKIDKQTRARTRTSTRTRTHAHADGHSHKHKHTHTHTNKTRTTEIDKMSLIHISEPTRPY